MLTEAEALSTIIALEDLEIQHGRLRNKLASTIDRIGELLSNGEWDRDNVHHFDLRQRLFHVSLVTEDRERGWESYPLSYLWWTDEEILSAEKIKAEDVLREKEKSRLSRELSLKMRESQALQEEISRLPIKIQQLRTEQELIRAQLLDLKQQSKKAL